MKPLLSLLLDDICAVCKEKVLPSKVSATKGVYHAQLRLLTHQGSCNERLESLYRSYDRSKRGRWRKSSEIYALLGLPKFLGWYLT